MMKEIKNTHVVVLAGGWNSEAEVSKVSGEACFKALSEKGYKTSILNPNKDISRFIADLQRLKPDCVFNALHGTWGEDGHVQAILDGLGICYTHSGMLASAIGMDKHISRQLFALNGLPIPSGKVISTKEFAKQDPMPRPYVAKPIADGSSVGVRIIQNNDERPDTNIWSSKNILVEEYIPGKELTTSVFKGKPIGVTELIPKLGFYDYDSKYTDGLTKHVCPAEIPKDVFSACLEYAKSAYEIIGCTGVARADFRWNHEIYKKNEELGLFLLEINTQPGMTPLSLTPEQVYNSGMSFMDFLSELINDAIERDIKIQ